MRVGRGAGEEDPTLSETTPEGWYERGCAVDWPLSCHQLGATQHEQRLLEAGKRLQHVQPLRVSVSQYSDRNPLDGREVVDLDALMSGGQGGLVGFGGGALGSGPPTWPDIAPEPRALALAKKACSLGGIGSCEALGKGPQGLRRVGAPWGLLGYRTRRPLPRRDCPAGSRGELLDSSLPVTGSPRWAWTCIRTLGNGTRLPDGAQHWYWSADAAFASDAASHPAVTVQWSRGVREGRADLVTAYGVRWVWEYEGGLSMLEERYDKQGALNRRKVRLPDDDPDVVAFELAAGTKRTQTFAEGRVTKEIFEPEGPRRSYHADGTLKDEDVYRAGRKRARRAWHDNGQLAHQITFDERARKHGLEERFLVDGTLQLREHWQHGQRHGPSFAHLGSKVRHGAYEAGRAVGSWRDEALDGTVIRTWEEAPPGVTDDASVPASSSSSDP